MSEIPHSPKLNPDATRCGNHPTEAAVDTCSRCGTFLCSECVDFLGDAVLCAACLERVGGNAPPSRRAWATALIGGLGFALPWLLFVFMLISRRVSFLQIPIVTVLSVGLSFFSFGLGRTELRRLQTPPASRRGRRLTLAGMILSAASVGLLLLRLLVVFSLVGLVVREPVGPSKPPTTLGLLMARRPCGTGR